MSDLIRRMDAIQACQVGPSDEWSRDTKSGYNQAATDCAMNILRVPAVPAQAQIDAAVLAERERCAKVAAERADYIEDAIKCGGRETYLTSLKGGLIELRAIAVDIREGRR
jgi:hypothetical protein